MSLIKSAQRAFKLLSLALGAFSPLAAQQSVVTEPAETTNIVDAAETNKPELSAVVGQILDKSNGAFIEEVYVVLESQDSDALDVRYTNTLANGSYVLAEIVPGTYTLKAVLSGYREYTITDLTLESGGLKRLNFSLTPKETDPDDIYVLSDFVVTAEEVESSQLELIDLRAANVGQVDFLSLEDFAKFGGASVADLVNRMVGVNVVEGQFAVVRGLGDRYNSTLVNGLPMPSVDPLRQGLQLDLFPTSIMSSIVSEKAFTPSLPSTSSGAAFNLQTREASDFFESWLEFGFSYLDRNEGFQSNPNAPNFKGMLMGDGVSGSRQTPVSKSISGLIQGGQSFNGGFTNTIYPFQDDGPAVRLVFSVSADTSRSFREGNQQDYFVTSSSYAIVPPGFPGLTLFGDPGSLFNNDFGGTGLSYDYSLSEEAALLGILGSVELDLSDDGENVVGANFIYSGSGISQVVQKSNAVRTLDYPQDYGYGRNLTGNNLEVVGVDSRSGRVRHNSTTFSYEDRSLSSIQLLGQHKPTLLEGLDGKVSWGWTESRASSELGDPDGDSGVTDLNYFRVNTAGNYKPTPTSPTYAPDELFFARSGNIADNISLPVTQETSRRIDDDTNGGRLDLDLTITENIILKSGLFTESSTRDVEQSDTQTFISNWTSSGVASTQELYDDVFSPGGASTVTEEFPSFATVEQERDSFYLSAKREFSWFEMDVGVRATEVSALAEGNGGISQTISLQTVLDETLPGNPTFTNGELIGFTDASVPGGYDEEYFLPAINLKVDLPLGLEGRLGFGRTIALPSNRELSPYFSRNLDTGDRILGNPNLQVSEVDNLNFRLSREFGDAYVAVSLFKKTIDKPIEQIGILYRGTGDSILTFFNNPNEAQVEGIEFEGRVSLGMINKNLENFNLNGNVALIDASVDFPEEVLNSYFGRLGTNRPVGPFVGTDGPDYGNNNLPTKRRLFDQPEWTVNADISYELPDYGFRATLAYYAQSEVLTAVGSGSALTVDQYTSAYHQIDFSLSKTFFDERMELSIGIDNLTNSERGITYDDELIDNPPERLSYTIGRTYSASLKYTF